MVGSPTLFGKKLHEARLAQGLSLRDLALVLGVSHVYLGEVERGLKSRLADEHWDKLLKALPEVTREELDEWAERSTILKLDLRQQSEADQNLSLVLARAIQSNRIISDQDRNSILRILGESDGQASR